MMISFQNPVFYIWMIPTVVMLLTGIRGFFSKSPLVFWNPKKVREVRDIPAYNRRVAKGALLFSLFYTLSYVPIVLFVNPLTALLSGVGILASLFYLYYDYSTALAEYALGS